jgi:ADP-heptose:LPS heptosyltransferase
MKILIIQLRRIGDILMTTPVLTYLKSTLPNVTIDFLSDPCGIPVLETNPHISNLWIYDYNRSWYEIRRIRKQKYDVVIDFMNNPRTAYIAFLSGAKWRVAYKKPFRSLFYNFGLNVPNHPQYVAKRKLILTEAWLRKAGFSVSPPTSYQPELTLKKEEEDYASAWIKESGLEGKPYAILVPASRREIRQWRLDGFREVGRSLHQRGVSVFLSCAPGEEAVVNEVRRGAENELKLLPSGDLRQVAALFKHAKLVISLDSGSAHIAVAVGTPTITIFGPSVPEDWSPSLDPSIRVKVPHMALRASKTEVPCLGCLLLDCPVGHLCMIKLTDETVLQASLQLLKLNPND